MDYENLKLKLNNLSVERNILEKDLRRIEEELQIQVDLISSLDRILILVLDLAQKQQEKIINYLEQTVTHALESIFGDEYSFHIQVEEKRGQQEISFFVKKGDILLEPRNNTQGGSIIDICSLGLRMACWALEEAPPILLLDEPFRFVDNVRILSTGNILKEMSKELGLQTIIITHKEELSDIADKIIRIE